jgi:hypothetical protein
MDLQIVNAVQWVLTRPERFFSSSAPDPLRLLAYLMADVLVLGGGSCTIHRVDDWWVVGSDADWLRHERFSVRELFERVVAQPEHGEHSMRAEILVAAFAPSVWLALQGDRVCIRGTAPPHRVWERAAGQIRVVAFSMTTV